MLQSRVIICLVLFSVVLYSCEKPGCTHSESYNYNPDATVEDGSCVPKVFGCIDSTSINYVPTANTDDGSCIPKVYGCMNPVALNYNPNANIDDGSCECNRDMFYGTYNIHSICSGVQYQYGSDTSDFVWVIYADSSNGCKVKIYNSVNQNIATNFVSGSNIVIPTIYSWNSYTGGTIILSGDTLIIYTYHYDYFAGAMIHECNRIGIKQ